MCDNTSHSSSGGGGGDNGGYGDDSNSIYSKKLKRQRVPKRGPGVAELEKILREQEKRNDVDITKSEGFSLVSSLPNSYQSSTHLVLASPNSLPKPAVSFASNPKHFSPPRPTFYNNKVSGNTTLVGKSGVQIAGSKVVLPEHTLLPTMWTSCESNVDVGESRSAPGFPFSTRLSNGYNTDQFFPPPSLMQRSQSTQSSANNLFTHPGVSCSTIPSSSVPCHGREPPSNQTTHHHSTSLWPEEDQMVGAKRSRPFSIEIPTAFRFQVPTFSPQVNRLDSSFSCSSRCLINLESSDAISREVKPNCSLESNVKKCNTDNGSASDCNFLLFGCPTTPPFTHTLQREGSKFNHFPLQESNSGSIQKKPFYSFLLPKDHIGIVENLENERIETRGDGIDLNLRL